METAEAMRSVRSQMNLSLAAEKGCKKATLVIIFISLCFQGKLENLKSMNKTMDLLILRTHGSTFLMLRPLLGFSFGH